MGLYVNAGQTCIACNHVFIHKSIANQVYENIIQTLDKFFKDSYVSYSGGWIRKHPEIEKIIEIYNKYFKR